MTRCLIRAMCFRWAPALMAVAIITIAIASCGVATASYRWMSMSLVVRLPPRRSCTAFCNCRRRFAVPAASVAKGKGHIMSLEKLQALAEQTEADFKEAIIESVIAFGELTLTVSRERIVEIMAKLKQAPYRFHQLID